MGMTTALDHNARPPEGSKTPIDWRRLLERLAVELGTPLIFLIALVAFSLQIATAIFILATLAVTGVSMRRSGHFPVVPALLAAVAVVFGTLTILFDDARWIEMRPTVVNGLAAAGILVGLLRGRLYLKSALQDGFTLDDGTWRTLSWRMVGFLVVLALLNEVVWRSFSTETWAVYKALVPLLNAGFIGLNVARLRAGLGRG